MEPTLKTTARVRGTERGADASARGMRRDMTPAERVLWNALRDRQAAGLKFRRQHPLGAFILDFCCPEQRLVIELDGGVHEEQRGYDEARTEHLNTFGYHVLRFPNEAVLSDLPSVLEQIRRAATSRVRSR